MESSGDPILDNLRMQLKKHGANGILGLARKFKIMDDDKVRQHTFSVYFFIAIGNLFFYSYRQPTHTL